MSDEMIDMVWIEDWVEPVIEERFDPDRTILSLEVMKKAAKKTQMKYNKILEYMEADKEYSIQDFCELLDLKESRTKDILKGLTDYVEPIGSNRNRKYRRKR